MRWFDDAIEQAYLSIFREAVWPSKIFSEHGIGAEFLAFRSAESFAGAVGYSTAGKRAAVQVYQPEGALHFRHAVVGPGHMRDSDRGACDAFSWEI